MEEVRVAYDHYRAVVAEIDLTGAWGSYADLFTEDAVVHRVGTPKVRGREAIRAMMLTDATTLPGSLIARTEVLWHSFDVARGRVVQELRHVARDPGDGSTHVALATGLLHYAGGGLWSGLDVQHGPHVYRTMYRGWARAAAASGNEAQAREVLALLGESDPSLPSAGPVSRV